MAMRGYSSKKYGPHKYSGHDHTSECEYACGCWAGPSNSGGPLGLDPIGGACPMNPEDGIRLGGKADYEEVVMQRIIQAEVRANRAEAALKAADPGALALAEQLKVAQRKIFEQDQVIEKTRTLLNSLQSPSAPVGS